MKTKQPLNFKGIFRVKSVHVHWESSARMIMTYCICCMALGGGSLRLAATYVHFSFRREVDKGEHYWNTTAIQ